MPASGNMLWTDQKVTETVTAAYIHSQLRANEQDILKRPLYFGGGLTNENYLDWIVGRAKRFFLILVATGVPDQIFGIVDDSFDDENLPVAERDVADLKLSFEPDTALDKRFFKTQFKFLVRVLEDGEHIRYAEEETVPITALGLKSVVTVNKDGIDTVRLSSDTSKLLVRRRINLDSHLTEKGILREIAESRRYAHEHVVSVFASYLQNNTMVILSTPCAASTLRSFLMDSPKAFEALSKVRRRQILLEWPHCLANALSWLHGNGGHHGAVRPGAINVDQNFSISLGSLEGEGVLMTTTKPGDIEAYNYASPEAWKMTLTTQSTGTKKVALPSGGRSSRKALHEPPEPPHPADLSTRRRSDSSGTTPVGGVHAFHPSSKNEMYTRFRLSSAVNPVTSLSAPPPRQSYDAVPENLSDNSRSTTRVTGHSSQPTRTSSALSYTSSEGKRASQKPRGMFLAAPEDRRAVVQTWKSIQHDSFAADVFSLGAVIMDILTVLCKRTFSSFARHRSSKNRNAGRGGGLADASFHANLGQVMVWAEQISVDAEKKVRKSRDDDTQPLQAVGAVVQITVQCLERNPEARLKSSALAERLREHLKRFANINPLHCAAQMSERRPSLPQQARAPKGPSPLLPPIHMRSERSSSRSRQATIEEEPPTMPSTVYSPSTRPTTSRTMVGSQSPPSVSLASLPSMTLDMEGRSDTVVSSQEPSLRHRSRRQRDAINSDNSKNLQTWTVPEVSTPKNERWEYIHGNESAVDPQLAPSSDGGEHFTFLHYSTSPSEDGDEETTAYHYPLPPPRPPPTRNLPPTPPSTKAGASEKPFAPASRRHAKSPPPVPSKEEFAMLRQLSRTAIGGHPPRMSSLDPSQSEDDLGELYHEKARGSRPSTNPAASRVKGDRRERVYRPRV